MASTTLDLPGVYLQTRPRVPAPPRVRTDVAGFVGFEPRLRPREAAQTRVPARHRVVIDVERFQVPIEERTVTVDPGPERMLVLAEGPGELVADSSELVFAVVAGAVADPSPTEDREPPRAVLLVVPGVASPDVGVAPRDDVIAAAIAADVAANRIPRLRGWLRLADIRLRREDPLLGLTVVPTLPPTVCEDWRDYELRCGTERSGMRLGECVRAFFADGGARCHITTVRRPFDTDFDELRRARYDMVGSAGVDRAGPATGLARLTSIDEVALVACPDLHARRSESVTTQIAIPPDASSGAFGPCGAEAVAPPPIIGTQVLDDPLYPDPDDVYETQRDLLLAAAGTDEVRVGATVHLVLSPPLQRDATTGRFRPPDGPEALAWRQRFATDAVLGDRVLAFGACYWPWLRRQDEPEAPTYDSPPDGSAVGIAAAVDLERGPFTAPANRSPKGVVGLATPMTADLQRRLYEPAIDGIVGRRGAVNPYQSSRGHGIELWGSRTLSGDRWFRHLAVRRGLSAIERRARRALVEVVFEPNTPLLQLQVTQLLLGILLPIHESGGLRGSTPEESFIVRCDEELNPVGQVLDGRLVCEVGVALAAPAEFVYFRLGRVGAAIEVTEP